MGKISTLDSSKQEAQLHEDGSRLLTKEERTGNILFGIWAMCFAAIVSGYIFAKMLVPALRNLF